MGDILKPEKNKTLLKLVGLIVLLTIIVAAISRFWPAYEEEFIELGLLGMDNTAERYLPNTDSILEVGSLINWQIYIHNHMMDVKDISVRVKLVDSTLQLPNDKENEPASSPSLTQFPLSLSVNETKLIPFSWGVTEVDYQNGSVGIKKLMINDQAIDVNVSRSTSSKYYVIFELWVYDPVSQLYTFGWVSEGKLSSASLYVGFRMTSSS